jgi:polysaccharide biosynthesis/export protein
MTAKWIYDEVIRHAIVRLSHESARRKFASGFQNSKKISAGESRVACRRQQDRVQSGAEQEDCSSGSPIGPVREIVHKRRAGTLTPVQLQSGYRPTHTMHPRKHSRNAARWLAALLCFAATSFPFTALGQSREALGEGDSIRITVFQNPDLTTETRISERGTITFPLIGEIALAGLTPSGAEARIAQQLIDGKFVLKPQVSLNVIRVRSHQVSVLGQVARPGRYPLDDTSSNLTDILALAGGISPTGDDKVIVMMKRNGKTAKLDVDVPAMYRAGDLSRDIQLENGDVIFVQRAPVFYIYGEVQRAGSYRLEPAMTVMQALSVGGGVTQRGTDRGLKIRRRTPDGEIRTIDARLTDTLQPDDVIYVRESLF